MIRLLRLLRPSSPSRLIAYGMLTSAATGVMWFEMPPLLREF